MDYFLKNKNKELDEFSKIFPILMNDIIYELEIQSFPKESIQWIETMLKANAFGGKMNRGISVLHSLELLKENCKLTSNEIFHAQILGWCIELFQAFFLVADDIMDQSITRRGQPCWYRQKKPNSQDFVGSIAINDAFLIESCIYIIIEKYFINESYYSKILNLFHKTSFQTQLGQLLDLINQPNRGDFSLFNLKRYNQIAQYKTAYYSFYLPVALAMLIAKINYEQAFSTAKDILLPMGEFFQVQDDFLDCYGSPAVIGKIGRDIEENKCSWMICQAILNGTPEQTEKLKKHYGIDNPSDVEIVKKIYDEINLKKVFKEYEDKSYNLLIEKIKSICIHVPQGVFLKLLSKIYKRDL
ncbi:hypothetical protein RB653_004448 [Dictyostelium firmibasis]|uniref:Farnesyl pyrophosphate synthase n=1 Tax=Dictyostelium firmibasis TaxID=79012 RepID=A0AAN7YSD4_9MYCE